MAVVTRSTKATTLADDLASLKAITDAAATNYSRLSDAFAQLSTIRRRMKTDSIGLANEATGNDTLVNAAELTAKKTPDELENITKQLEIIENQLLSIQAKHADGAPPPPGPQPGTTTEEMQYGTGTTARTDPTFGGLVERASDGLTLTKVMGVSAAAFITYIGFIMIGTDNASVVVKSIKVIQDETNGNLIGAEITYDPNSVILSTGGPGTGDCFHPCVSDSFHFQTDGDGNKACLDRDPTDTWYTIQKVEGNTLTIDITGVPQGSFTRLTTMTRISGGGKYAYECPEGGRIQIKTSFGSQFVGGMSSITQLAVDVLEKALTTAITVATNAAGQLAGAGKNIFCSTLPIVCNVVFWILLFVIILGGLLLFSFLKSRTKS